MTLRTLAQPLPPFPSSQSQQPKQLSGGLGNEDPDSFTTHMVHSRPRTLSAGRPQPHRRRESIVRAWSGLLRSEQKSTMKPALPALAVLWVALTGDPASAQGTTSAAIDAIPGLALRM